MALAARRQGVLYWGSIFVIVATVAAVAGIFLGVWRLPFTIIDLFGVRNSPAHWVGWAGTLYIGLFTPVYFLVKRFTPKHMLGFLKAHTLGNLLSVGLVSVHFAHQVTRPPTSYPELGTGIVLYVSMLLLASSGFAVYYGYLAGWMRQLRFLHPAVALTFYMTIVLHIIHGI